MGTRNILRNESENKCLRERVEVLYGKLSERMCQTPEAFRFDDFKIRDGKLYYRDRITPLMNK